MCWCITHNDKRTMNNRKAMCTAAIRWPLACAHLIRQLHIVWPNNGGHEWLLRAGCVSEQCLIVALVLTVLQAGRRVKDGV